MSKTFKILILVLIVIGFGFAVSQSKTIDLPFKIRMLVSEKYALASPPESKIEPKIYEELTVKEEARVVVILKEDLITSTQKLAKKEEINLRKEKIKENQDRVLLTLSKPEFKLKNRYRTINAFSGFATKGGIEKLENNPDVERVYLDKIAYASLSQSIPLINADDVWASGYTGSGQAVCVIDTGVDYYHSDLGNPSCTITQTINGNIESYSLESPHPYSNNYDNTWQITKPGYTNIAVYFSKIEVEANYDFVYLYNAQGNFVQVFTGNYYDIWSVSIPGDTIYVRLVTDSSVTAWGFAINQVLNGTVDSTWGNCGQIIGGYDFVNNDNDPMDDNGHGTHVSGIVASQNPTYKGVAPGANIVATKVLDSGGSGWFSNVAAGVDWCIDNMDTYNISVISMSLGDGGQYNNPAIQCDPYETAQAISVAVSQGIFVSVASGNEAYTNGISYPACASDATSVGATYDADVGWKKWLPTCQDKTTAPDQIVCFTNRDEILDLLAPGCETTSLKLNGGTATYCGTSMSAPHVAGAAALLLEANPSLTPTQIRDTLKSTGVGIYDSATKLTFPRIDAKAALDSILPEVAISLVSVTTPGLVNFGIVALNTTVDNSGDIETVKIDVGPANLDVKSTVFSAGTYTWNLGLTNGPNQVKWEFASSTVGPWTTFATTTDVYSLASGLNTNATSSLYLKLTMPIETSSTAPYSSTVTIVATAP